ncbi:DUF1704 domain-containing protein [Pendulispora rubella]|uniref:DUF1704 domain-containing protein n=1 Tax=Pendulispora rubella TaxID=2741070 RepID=A0ABZ2KUD2_9BACT
MLPAWLRQVDPLLRELSQRVTLLGAATPANAREERVRLQGLAASGKAAVPAWEYVRRDMSVLRRQLDAVASALHELRDEPLADLYMARVQEWRLEASLCACVGTKEASSLAARRFASFDAETEAAADALAEDWILPHPDPPAASGPPTPGAETADARAPSPSEVRGLPRPTFNAAGGSGWGSEFLETDSPHPESLLSLLQAEIGRRRIPFAVVVHPHLSALAATGHQTVLVAAGRRIGPETAHRTVLHEIEGHVLPRARAAHAPLAIFSVGTARSADEQEGYALVLEDRHHFLTPSRRRELAGRYRAVRRMREGATFVDVVRDLAGVGIDPREAVVMGERAFRGSDGTFPGLGRERVYLESYLRVRARLSDVPDDEAVLASGQIALDAIPALRPWCAST